MSLSKEIIENKNDGTFLRYIQRGNQVRQGFILATPHGGEEWQWDKPKPLNGDRDRTKV
jgi:hypothetical protein